MIINTFRRGMFRTLSVAESTLSWKPLFSFSSDNSKLYKPTTPLEFKNGRCLIYRCDNKTDRIKYQFMGMSALTALPTGLTLRNFYKRRWIRALF